MNLSRRIGIEMEGYITDYPRDISISFVDIGSDGSLDNSNWDDDDDYMDTYGVELRTEPFTSLDNLNSTWADMQQRGWSVNSSAGTHIHVEINDFNSKDKAKLLRFGKAIERIIFMFQEESRYSNNYCLEIHKDWRRIFNPESKYSRIDWASAERDLEDYLRSNFASRRNTIWNGKYQWMNVLGSNYPTVEYRLFHGVKNVEELKQQAQMAVAIVELAKNSTVEQLEFIIKHIYRQKSVDDIINVFFEALGLDFVMPTKCVQAREYLENKVSSRKTRKAVTV